MQIVPSTGRQLARSLGIRRFTTKMLTNPEINVRMGTLYFSRLVQQFGGTYYALASYNAGENRVVRWKAERPGLDEDEFIDDIPFPETQNYVKRILGTAEDYRQLYGKGGGRPLPVPSDASKRAVGSSPRTKSFSCQRSADCSKTRLLSSARLLVAQMASLRPADNLVNHQLTVIGDDLEVRQIRLQPPLDVRPRPSAVALAAAVERHVAHPTLLQRVEAVL